MIPDASDPNWEKLLRGEIKSEYKFFALKLLLTRLQNVIERDEATLTACIAEFHSFCSQHESNPQLREDIKQIFAK